MERPKGSSLREPAARRLEASGAGQTPPSYGPSAIQNLQERPGASQFWERPKQQFIGSTATYTSNVCEKWHSPADGEDA